MCVVDGAVICCFSHSYAFGVYSYVYIVTTLYTEHTHNIAINDEMCGMVSECECSAVKIYDVRVCECE